MRRRLFIGLIGGDLVALGRDSSSVLTVPFNLHLRQVVLAGTGAPSAYPFDNGSMKGIKAVTLRGWLQEMHVAGCVSGLELLIVRK